MVFTNVSRPTTRIPSSTGSFAPTFSITLLSRGTAGSWAATPFQRAQAGRAFCGQALQDKQILWELVDSSIRRLGRHYSIFAVVTTGRQIASLITPLVNMAGESSGS